MLSRLSDGLNRASEVACCVILLAMTLVVILQVVCRYVISAALTWSEELARYSLVWITFVGAGMASKRGGHMALEAMVKRFSPRAQVVVKLITLLFDLSGLIICKIHSIFPYGCDYLKCF